MSIVFLFFFRFKTKNNKSAHKKSIFHDFHIRTHMYVFKLQHPTGRPLIFCLLATSPPLSWYLSDSMWRDRYHIVHYVQKNKRLGWKPNTKYVLR